MAIKHSKTVDPYVMLAFGNIKNRHQELKIDAQIEWSEHVGFVVLVQNALAYHFFSVR